MFYVISPVVHWLIIWTLNYVCQQVHHTNNNHSTIRQHAGSHVSEFPGAEVVGIEVDVIRQGLFLCHKLIVG